MDSHLEDEFRKLVNHLPSLPEDGSAAPNMENDKTEESESIRDGESPVVLQKILTEIYIYTSADDKNMWYGQQSIQDVYLLGKMRLAEAHKIIQGAKKKRRRK
jgi:hypothetical protein